MRKTWSISNLLDLRQLDSIKGIYFYTHFTSNDSQTVKKLIKVV